MTNINNDIQEHSKNNHMREHIIDVTEIIENYHEKVIIISNDSLPNKTIRIKKIIEEAKKEHGKLIKKFYELLLLNESNGKYYSELSILFISLSTISSDVMKMLEIYDQCLGFNDDDLDIFSENDFIETLDDNINTKKKLLKDDHEFEIEENKNQETETRLLNQTTETNN